MRIPRTERTSTGFGTTSQGSPYCLMNRPLGANSSRMAILIEHKSTIPDQRQTFGLVPILLSKNNSQMVLAGKLHFAYISTQGPFPSSFSSFFFPSFTFHLRIESLSGGEHQYNSRSTDSLRRSTFEQPCAVPPRC